jgi:hypothetical protein
MPAGFLALYSRCVTIHNRHSPGAHHLDSFWPTDFKEKNAKLANGRAWPLRDNVTPSLDLCSFLGCPFTSPPNLQVFYLSYLLPKLFFSLEKFPKLVKSLLTSENFCGSCGQKRKFPICLFCVWCLLCIYMLCVTWLYVPSKHPLEKSYGCRKCHCDLGATTLPSMAHGHSSQLCHGGEDKHMFHHFVTC